MSSFENISFGLTLNEKMFLRGGLQAAVETVGDDPDGGREHL